MGYVLSTEDLRAARAYHRQREASCRDARETRRRDALATARRAIEELAPGEHGLRMTVALPASIDAFLRFLQGLRSGSAKASSWQ